MLSKDVLILLKSRGFFVQRVESVKTGRGIPDIYWAKDGESGWLELKVVKQSFTGINNVRWQEGQQVWQRDHNRQHDTCLTLIAYKDCFVMLHIDRIYAELEPFQVYETATTLKEILL